MGNYRIMSVYTEIFAKQQVNAISAIIFSRITRPKFSRFSWVSFATWLLNVLDQSSLPSSYCVTGNQ